MARYRKFFFCQTKRQYLEVSEEVAGIAKDTCLNPMKSISKFIIIKKYEIISVMFSYILNTKLADMAREIRVGLKRWCFGI